MSYVDLLLDREIDAGVAGYHPLSISLENDLGEQPQSIRAIYEKECAHLELNRTFVKDVIEIEQAFVTKKPEHIEFFGGTLTGVHVIRFTDQEFDRFFLDLLQVDEEVIKEQVHRLPDINPEFKISSNIFNISCVWLMHAIHHSPQLSKEQKREAKIRVALYLNYRFLTSILYNFFKYPANEETAKATYAQLSNRFILKATGSWGAALRMRSEDIIDESSIWYKTIDKLDDDYAVVRMLNDIQGRIKSMVRNIYSVFINVHQQGTKIGSSSTMTEIDGETILKDKVNSLSSYTRYIKTVIPDKNSFVREELLDVTANAVQTAPPHVTKEFLYWFSANYTHFKNNEADKLVNLIMEHAFEYLSENSKLLRHKEGLVSILSKIRGTYTSSRANDPKLMEIKDKVERYVRDGTKVKNEAVIASVRTAFCLYLIARAFTMRHYLSK
jgi:hypothetical protein